MNKTISDDPLKLTEQDILDYIKDNSDSELACFCDDLGSKATLDLVELYGGSTVYIPNLDFLRKQKRAQQITKDFHNGVNISKIARHYHIADKTVRNIINGKVFQK